MVYMPIPSKTQTAVGSGQAAKALYQVDVEGQDPKAPLVEKT